MASSSHRLEESIDRFSASAMRQKLQSCQATRRKLQERVSALEDSLSYKKILRENYLLEATMYEGALKSCIEGIAEVAVECSMLESEMIKVTMPHEQSAKTEVSISTEDLKSCNKKKKMIASASIELENLMEKTRKLASEFASFKMNIESMITNFKRAEKEDPTRGVVDALFLYRTLPDLPD